MCFAKLQMLILVSECYHMVLIGTQWEVRSPLRIRYAPRAEILGDARVSAFFVLLYTHTVPTNAFVSIPTKNRYALNSAFLTACR